MNSISKYPLPTTGTEQDIVVLAHVNGPPVLENGESVRSTDGKQVDGEQPVLIDKVCSWAPAGYQEPYPVSCRALTAGILGRPKYLETTPGRLTSEKTTAKMSRSLTLGMLPEFIPLPQVEG